MMITRKNLQISEPDANGMVKVSLHFGVQVEAEKVEIAKQMIMQRLLIDLYRKVRNLESLALRSMSTQISEAIELHRQLNAWRKDISNEIDGTEPEEAVPASPKSEGIE